MRSISNSFVSWAVVLATVIHTGCHQKPSVSGVVRNGSRSQPTNRADLIEQQQTMDVRTYLQLSARLQNQRAVYQLMQDAFRSAGQPEHLRDIVQQAFERCQKTEQELQEIEKRLPRESSVVGPASLDLPAGTWIRLVLFDEGGLRRTTVQDLDIELSDVDSDGTCDLNLRWHKEKISLDGLHQGDEAFVLGFVVRVSELHLPLEQAILLIRRASRG